MIGVTARSLQLFVTDGYGQTAWQDVTRAARSPEPGFELLMSYPTDLTERIIAASAERLGRPRAEMLEDLGIYLVSHPNMNMVRRMMRYSGRDFEAFIEALPDLPDRAQLVLPHIGMPPLRVAWEEDGLYLVDCRSDENVTCHVLTGIIRAMADDFGALAVTSLVEGGAPEGWRRIEVDVPMHRFSPGRSFELPAQVAQ